jgi:hypothetical protein
MEIDIIYSNLIEKSPPLQQSWAEPWMPLFYWKVHWIWDFLWNLHVSSPTKKNSDDLFTTCITIQAQTVLDSAQFHASTLILDLAQFHKHFTRTLHLKNTVALIVSKTKWPRCKSSWLTSHFTFVPVHFVK